MRCLESVLFVAYVCFMFLYLTVSVINAIIYYYSLIIYHYHYYHYYTH